VGLAVPLPYYYAIGTCLFGAVAYWFLRETGDPARPIDSITGEPLKPPAKTRAQELTEARGKILRQIEILQSPVGSSPRNAPPYVEYELAELKALLDEIDEELRG
jgi:hypothetical protein